MTDKEALLMSISNEPIAVIQTAYVYAKNFCLYGSDVTKKWLTATENAANLDAAYRRGFEDAIKKFKESKAEDNQNC